MSPRISAINKVLVTLCAQRAGPAGGVNAKPMSPRNSVEGALI